ncbi:MAG: sec-independent protein translocase protein TatC [Sphingobacteriales bacterium]|jgi:sec-independent protein translocase protein TatC
MSEEQEMSFLDHLEQLRWTLVRSVIGIASVAILAFFAKSFIFDVILLGPKSGNFWTYRMFCELSKLLGMGEAFCVTDLEFSLQNISMSGQFSTHILVSAIAGLIGAFPFVVYQFWSFLKPGLQEKEQKATRGVVFYSSMLFLTGILFGYFLIAPLSVRFLGAYKVSEFVVNQISLNSYITTVTTVTLASGILFLLPIFIYFLTKAGVVSSEFLRAYRKHALVAVLLLSAIITPPDITSQLLVTGPVFLLYEVGIKIAKRVEKGNESKA